MIEQQLEPRIFAVFVVELCVSAVERIDIQIEDCAVEVRLARFQFACETISSKFIIRKTVDDYK